VGRPRYFRLGLSIFSFPSPFAKAERRLPRLEARPYLVARRRAPAREKSLIFVPIPSWLSWRQRASQLTAPTKKMRNTRSPPPMISRVADAVGMRTSAGKLAAINNQILVPDRPILKPAFQDFSGSSRVSSLG